MQTHNAPDTRAESRPRRLQGVPNTRTRNIDVGPEFHTKNIYMMTRFPFSDFCIGLKDFFSQPEWRLWPFGPGYGDTLLPAVARLLFAALILGLILLFLRFLFGPGGIWRDKELEAEAEEQRLAEIAELEEQLRKNEISEAEYKIKMKGLK